VSLSADLRAETGMSPLLHRYATPLILGLFAVSAVSGMALSFHSAIGTFHGMHEWLSVALLVAFAVHVWTNRTPLLGYLRRGAMMLPVGASMVAGLAFVVPALSGGTRKRCPQIHAVRLLA
jgi:hypothetical protein